ncbi:MAG TPA: hypothetical protein VHM90_07245 [Phycisphaerae bacterium]|nr:hypothetical protein [Phycisphaerae bacterium]
MSMRSIEGAVFSGNNSAWFVAGSPRDAPAVLIYVNLGSYFPACAGQHNRLPEDDSIAADLGQWNLGLAHMKIKANLGGEMTG